MQLRGVLTLWRCNCPVFVCSVGIIVYLPFPLMTFNWTPLFREESLTHGKMFRRHWWSVVSRVIALIVPMRRLNPWRSFRCLSFDMSPQSSLRSSIIKTLASKLIAPQPARQNAGAWFLVFPSTRVAFLSRDESLWIVQSVHWARLLPK